MAREYDSALFDLNFRQETLSYDCVLCHRMMTLNIDQK